MSDTKRHEARLRRAAARQGLQLQKSRARDPHAIGYGTYHLANPATGTLEVWGLPSGYGLTLDEIDEAMQPFGGGAV